MGAEGALIGFGTLATAEQVEMVELTKQGRWDEARAIWDRILPLEEVVYGSPVRDYRARTKVALKELGVIHNTDMRFGHDVPLESRFYRSESVEATHP